MGLSPGDLIDDKYRIVRLLGEGGMGAVYEGENVRIHRRVAIKVLHYEVAKLSDVVARFEREAQAAGRIGSEHIVEVLDLGTLSSGDRYMVMEFLDGDSFSKRIRERGRLSPTELYPIARQLMAALAAAHSAGIIHRDLKPDNVFLLKSRRGEPEFVKLLDFGISKFSGANNAFSMTRTGAVMGTPYYMAPEQARGTRELDHRVDLYAVGVILYEALAGQVPFNADTFNELLFKIVLETPAPLRDVVPDLDPAFAAIVSRAMAREPADRFQTAEELEQALDAWRAAAPQQGASSAAVQNPNPAARAAAAPPLGTTPGVWAGEPPAEVAVKPKRNPTLVIAALAAVTVIGGGAALLLGSAGKSGDAAPEPSATEASKSAATLPLAGSAQAPPREAERAPPAATVAVEPVASSAAPAKQPAPVVEAKPKSAAVAPRPVSAKPAPARPAEPVTGGRKIRKSL